MNKQALRMLMALGIAGILALPAAYGQAKVTAEANIPFRFHVGDQAFPPGTYTISTYSTYGQGVILLRSADSSRAKVVLTNSEEASVVPERGSLVFNRYGDRYFLSTIWVALSRDGHMLNKSKAEIEMARSVSKAEPVQVALIPR